MTGQAVSTCDFNERETRRRVSLRAQSSVLTLAPQQWLAGAQALSVWAFQAEPLGTFLLGGLRGPRALDMKPKLERFMTAVKPFDSCFYLVVFSWCAFLRFPQSEFWMGPHSGVPSSSWAHHRRISAGVPGPRQLPDSLCLLASVSK